MHLLDWLILAGFFVYTLWDGLKHAGKHEGLDSVVLAGRSTPWWAAGLSVMATQASAITFISTTGLAYVEDMKFLQFYLGLPLAMVILSVTLVPLYYKLKVYTIYEALENRFGLRLRLMTSAIFLLSKGVTVGFAIAAPAYVLSLLFHISLTWTILLMGLTATIYTMFGGIGGVIRTDMKQMFLMIFALIFCSVWIIWRLPEEVSFVDSLQLAGTLGKLEIIDTQFDLGSKYNIWSGLIAGTFLMLSYFGADQPQVQRVLTAKSLTDARSSLLMSAVLKLPMQFFILLLGILMYVFYIYHPAPLVFHEGRSCSAAMNQSFDESMLERRFLANKCLEENGPMCEAFQKKDKEINEMRHTALVLSSVKKEKIEPDTNYIFPYFMLHELPVGILGLILAGIFAAALSSIDSVLNSLATSSVVDWLRRLQREKRSEGYYLRATRITTALWGIFATSTALAFGETDAIIEIVNQLGSLVYGPILGVFLLLWQKRATSRSVFWAFLLGVGTVMVVGGWQINCFSGEHSWHFPLGGPLEGYKNAIEYLWLNPLGVSVVFVVGWLGGSEKMEG